MRLFPNRTTMPDGTEHTATLLISDGRKFAVVAHQAGEYVVLAEGPSSSLIGTGPVFHVKRPDGTLTIARDTTDCGCGHPLKTYTPTFEGLPSLRRVYTSPEVEDAPGT